jgi:hypothetical protein
MADIMYVHTWSNGDITIYCYNDICRVAPRNLNHAYLVGTNRRAFSRNNGEGNLVGKTRFVGCQICKRGAEVEILYKTVYKFDFGITTVGVYVMTNYLGGPLYGHWTFCNDQDIYDGKN